MDFGAQSSPERFPSSFGDATFAAFQIRMLLSIDTAIHVRLGLNLTNVRASAMNAIVRCICDTLPAPRNNCLQQRAIILYIASPKRV
jgi:hypothetical protein